MKFLAEFFEFERNQTTLMREVVAGLTTFTTMSYIVVVNPAILSNAGIPQALVLLAAIEASSLPPYLSRWLAVT